jgi:hypothetical protein
MSSKKVKGEVTLEGETVVKEERTVSKISICVKVSDERVTDDTTKSGKTKLQRRSMALGSDRVEVQVALAITIREKRRMDGGSQESKAGVR